MENILENYDKEVRDNPFYPEIVKIVRNEHILRLEVPGSFNFISYWNIPENQALEIIHDEIEYLKSTQLQSIWRVFDHDLPLNLESGLKVEGLKQIDSVTLMVKPLREIEIKKSEHDVRILTEASELVDYLSVTENAFGEPNPQDIKYLSKTLSFQNFKYFVAYSNGLPVAAAKLEISSNSSFGLLFEGCVIPEYRGKGFYNSLIAARLRLAIQLGLDYVCTEARETSRPMLEGLGFKPLVKGRTWGLVSNT